MITLTPSKAEQAHKANNSQQSNSPVETAGSLAMLFDNGLMTMGQYDEYVSNNPFTVNYSDFANYGNDSIAFNGGFLSNFANAFSVLSSDGGFSAGGCGSFSGGGFSSGSCGGFSSFC